MSEGTVELCREIPVLVAESTAEACEHLRCSLSEELAVTFVVEGDTTVTVDILHLIGLLAGIVGLEAVVDGETEDVDRIALGHVDDVGVGGKTVTACTVERDVLGSGQILSLVCTGEADELVLLECDVALEGESHVPGLDGSDVEADLDTVVGHLTHVCEEGGIGERRDRYLIGVEEVACSRHVSVDGTAEPAAPHREVDTGVEGVLGLPLQVGIRIGIESVGGDGCTVIGSGTVRGHQGQ